MSTAPTSRRPGPPTARAGWTAVLARQSAVGRVPRRRRCCAAAGATSNNSSAARPDAAPAAARRPSVAVLGGGVIGWATALAVASLPSRPATTLVAASFDDTTSHGAGGLWEPYKCGDTDPALINAWGGATLAHLRALYASPEAGPAGVTEHAVFQLWTSGGPSPHPPDPTWAGVVPHFRRLSRAELDAWEAVARHTPGPAVAYSSGWTFWTATAQPTRYLPWLAAKARGAGVETVTARVARLGEVAGVVAGAGAARAAAAAAPPPPPPDVVVNCAGLGARDALPDVSLTPVRGQVARLGAPWVKSAVFVDENTYVIPNIDFTVVGGTAQAGDFDAAPRAADRADILARAAWAVPGLLGAEALGDWAGLRPVRPSVRVDAEEEEDEEAQEEAGTTTTAPAVVHNYGHGGSGVTLHWGCAAAAAELVEKALARRGFSVVGG